MYRKLDDLNDRATDIIGAILFKILLLFALTFFTAIVGYVSYRAIIGQPVSITVLINGFRGDWHQVSTLNQPLTQFRQ